MLLNAFASDKLSMLLSDHEERLEWLNKFTKWPTAFRVSEMPLLLSDDLNAQLLDASKAILEQLQSPSVMERSFGAIPSGWGIPGCGTHPHYIQLDFGVCREGDRLVPQLIELQGFASMFCYQTLVDRFYRKSEMILEGWSAYYSGLEEESYLAALEKCIVGQHKPENVATLEIHPEGQKTRIDFSATEKFFGVPTVNIFDIEIDQGQLYYSKDNERVDIQRVYNRVILQELLEQEGGENLLEKLKSANVEWSTHPDWFLRISKHTLPALNHSCVPETVMLQDWSEMGESLSDWVLKPIHSFAGQGVVINIRDTDLTSIENPDNYIMQRKVRYEPCMWTPTGPVKVEVRIMVLWSDSPIIANTLVRLSRGETSNVAANASERFIGATTGYHRV